VNLLALHASVNKSPLVNDAKGAFIPQAQVFAKIHTAAGHTVTRVPFANDLLPAARKKAFYDAIRAAKGLDGFAYFGHGLRTSLPSAGLQLSDIPELAKLLAAATNPDTRTLRIALYACSAAASPLRVVVRTDDEGVYGGEGSGDGGFADLLRDALAQLKIKGHVDAHINAGHTTTNPYVKRFVSDGEHTGVGGEWLVSPKDAKLFKAFRKKLTDDRTFRMNFTFMEADAVRAALVGG